MSPELKKKLEAWLAEASADDPDYMVRHYGICAFIYLRGDADISAELNGMLRAEFAEDSRFPFGGVDTFNSEFYYGSAHKNERRIAWVKGKIAQ